MEYFSSTASKDQNFSRGLVLEDYQFVKRAATQSPDVFLSHSSKDESSVLEAIAFLKRFGVNVYIDKNDKELPEKTSPETGKRLKDRIDEHRKFVVFASENSMDSRWIPWELGIADQRKTLRNVAILPDRKNETNVEWSEREYLGLYPRIARNNLKGYSGPQWLVYYHHENYGIELSEWLKQ